MQLLFAITILFDVHYKVYVFVGTIQVGSDLAHRMPESDFRSSSSSLAFW